MLSSYNIPQYCRHIPYVFVVKCHGRTSKKLVRCVRFLVFWFEIQPNILLRCAWVAASTER
jgi:hypothetical protein